MIVKTKNKKEQQDLKLDLKHQALRSREICVLLSRKIWLNYEPNIETKLGSKMIKATDLAQSKTKSVIQSTWPKIRKDVQMIDLAKSSADSWPSQSDN